VSQSQRRSIIVGNRPPGGAIKILILSVLERPEEREETGQAEAQCQRHKNDKDFHQDLRTATERARSAFTMTRIEEPDIAAAAISGVTMPLIASGTASTL